MSSVGSTVSGDAHAAVVGEHTVAVGERARIRAAP